MLHLLPDSFAPAAGSPYNEAVVRLAGIRRALIVAEQAGGGAAAAVPELRTPTAWPEADAARQRRFDARTIEGAQAASAGLEVIAAQREAGLVPNPHAIAKLADILRGELAELDQLFSL